MMTIIDEQNWWWWRAFPLLICMYKGDCLEVPGLSLVPYTSKGDINIGLLVNIKRYSVDNFCKPYWGSPEHSQLAETLPYIVKRSNERMDLLPNITLGYVVLDACERDITALAKALSLLPNGKYFT